MRRFVAWLAWQRVPAEEFPSASPRRETLVLLGVWALHVAAALGAGLLISRWPLRIAGASDWIQDWWYSGAFKLGLMLLLPLVLMRRWGLRVRDLLAGWRPTPDELLIVACAYAMGFALNLGRVDAVGVACGRHAPAEALARLLGGLALALFTAAVPEELFYRGLLQTRLQLFLGRVPAWLLAAILFTAWHLPSRYIMSNGVEGIAGDLPSVLLGTGAPVLLAALVLGWSWDRHRNLPAIVAAHWGIDTLPIVASMLQCTPQGR